MRAVQAFILSIALIVGSPSVSFAQEPYAGSARVSPYLLAAHLQLALNHLRHAEAALEPSDGRGAVRLDLAPVRQSLAEASDELSRARMATVDPDQIRALDAMLAGIEAVRNGLDTRMGALPPQLRRLEGEMLALHRTARSQIAMREDVLLREEAKHPADR